VESVANDWADWDDEDYGYNEYDENDTDWLDHEFDYDAAHYENDAGNNDPVLDYEFDVAEYDSCYASYLDARKRFNDLRRARGFLPVVALDFSASSTSTSPTQMPMQSNMKGKGKKGKAKGKGKNNNRPPRPPMKTPDPRGRAQAALNAPSLRCGSSSHKTANCTQSSKETPESAPAGNAKRQAVESMACLKIPQPDCAMMDPGASFFLMGIGPLTNYLEHLGKPGFPINQIKFKKADRTFHFGGDHKAVSNWTVHLPIYLNNKFGLVQAFVLQGETPMLLGRPIAKANGLTVDFLNDPLRYNDGEWRAATLGRQMEYLLP